MPWTYLETAPDQITAEMWLQVLHDAGIAARIRPSDAVSFLGVAGFGCRVEVDEADAAEGRAILDEITAEQ